MPPTIPPIVGDQTVIDAGFWLKAAHGAVRRFCGWHVAPTITETITLDGRGGADVLLPSLRVVELTSVLNDGVDVTANVDTSRAGILRLVEGTWTDRLGRITVTLTHGYDLDEVPEVAAIIAGVAKRGPNAGRVDASESVNGSSRGGVLDRGAPISIPLLLPEREALADYRLEWGSR
ncbi:hypothetical protein [Microbacterium luteum]|uniref:hypothetical protein n=1 Tax=Microbacterium luteum TaxID=2782167 RepID=UPI0018874001|nr:hypothetical protein [Microbacterium luteum]